MPPTNPTTAHHGWRGKVLDSAIQLPLRDGESIGIFEKTLLPEAIRQCQYRHQDQTQRTKTLQNDATVIQNNKKPPLAAKFAFSGTLDDTVQGTPGALEPRDLALTSPTSSGYVCRR